MKKHYETYVEDTDKLISVAGPVLDYKSWYEQYRKLMEEQAQRKYGLYTPTSEGDDDDFPSITGMIARYSASGLTNEQMAENPVWKDLTGNGHDLQMKNFSWKGMSGVGGYAVDIDEWGTNSTAAYYERNSIKITATFKENASLGLLYHNIKLRQSCVLKVTGIPEGCDAFLDDRLGNRFYMSEDGVYEIIPSNFLAEALYLSIEKYPERWYRSKLTIEQLPLYPGFILGDGVDDFAVTEKELNFEDTYTVYTAFIPFQNNPTRNMILCGADSKKTFSMQYSSLVYVSFIAGNNYYINADFVNGLNLFACKRNGNNIYIKNLLTNKVVTGTCGDWVENAGLYYLWKNATYASFAKAAIAGQTICNGYFSTDEDDEKVLDWYKKQYPWLFPDQAWTVTGKTNEDEDRATIANITGNGNNLVLSNFGFAGNSGYGEYAYNWNKWGVSNGDATNVSKQYNKFVAVMPVNQSISTCSLYSTEVSIGTKFQFKLKITGLTTNWTVRVIERYTEGANIIYEFDKDGTYQIDHTMTGSGNQLRLYIRMYCAVPNTEGTTVTIEQIPEYEGYLVTDGVDDEVKSSSFSMAKDFTVVGEWELLDKDDRQSGLAKSASFYLYSRVNGFAFYCKDLSKPELLNLKSIVAFNSKGVVYDNKWQEYTNNVVGNNPTYDSRFYLGYDNNNYSKVAFKNLATYVGRILSKEDMIKAYIYLQTLKAK